VSLVSLLLVLLLLAVIAAIAVVAAGGGGESLEDEDTDRAPFGRLPPGPVRTEEVRRLRFSLAFRGYRMDEVDAVLGRLTDEIDERDRMLRERDEADGRGPVRPAPGEQPLPPWTQG
jgi:DivIVA domain-containing protein